MVARSKNIISDTCFFINIIIFSGLLYLCYTMKPPVTEGITNMNCCGGVEAGVHYSETDRKPPDYIKRCFVSNENNGETVYEWNGFPCTGKDDQKCCKNGGECTASSKGGYCRRDNGTKYIFRRQDGGTSSPYIKRVNDHPLDVNDANDMEDYFYERRGEDEYQQLSPEMRRFMARRSQSEEFIEGEIVSRNASRARLIADTLEQNKATYQNYQIVYTITLIHLILLTGILIVIRKSIIAKIQTYVDVLTLQYHKFAGQ